MGTPPPGAGAAGPKIKLTVDCTERNSTSGPCELTISHTASLANLSREVQMVTYMPLTLVPNEPWENVSLTGDGKQVGYWKTTETSATLQELGFKDGDKVNVEEPPR